MSKDSAKKLIDHDVEMFKKYKDLLMELTRKNVKLKYRNSWLGVLWSFFQPLLNMIVLSVSLPYSERVNKCDYSLTDVCFMSCAKSRNKNFKSLPNGKINTRILLRSIR